MRALAVVAVVCLVGCGRSPSTPSGEAGDGEAAQQQVQAPVDAAGRYEFGPTVPQGFAGTPGRLADLRVDADGAWSMSWFVGCLVQGATGTWTSQGGEAVLAIDRGSWTDDEGVALGVTAVRATPRATQLFVPAGLEIRFTTADGRRHTQFWDKVGP